MAVNRFIPKVWSARLQDKLHRNLVFGRLCNRHYEGDIARWGDTVHINSLADITVRPYTPGEDLEEPDELGGSDAMLVINHGAYCNFYLNDVDAAQARADLMEAAMRGAAGRLAEDTEDYILGVIHDGAGATVSKAIPAGGVYDLIVDIKTALDGKHVPRAGRALVVPPSIEANLLKDSRFVSGNGAISEKALADGCIARAAGFDIYISPALNNEMIAMTEDGVTFAQQITKMEAYRREKGFDDAVKALSLCGAKVVLPDCVYVCKITG